MCISVETLAGIMTTLTVVVWVGIPACLIWWAIQRL